MLVALAAMSVAMAQDPNTPFPSPGTAPPLSQSPPTFNTALGADVLGAHNGYGRGCVMCHAPHGGAQGNAAPNGGSDTYNGNTALWGENLNPYYGQTVTFTVSPQGTTYSVTLPSANLLNNPSNNSGDTAVILCLSCHDGALTRPAMMQGQTVEALPIVGGTAPTLFGLTAGNSQLNYINEHPVGPIASVGAGTWGCTVGGGDTTTKLAGCGTAFFTFALTNYPASIWYAYANSNGASGYPLAKFTGTVNGVTCTTCHNQHSMTVYSNGSGSYPTMFFIKGEYWPYTGGNSVAQFCRNCHSGESNEMSGLMSVPTT
jgi:cytochrome c5